MKNTITILLIVLFGVKSIAQTDSLHLPFQNLDFSYTNTNILIDYGIEFIPIENFNGSISDNNAVSIKEWRSIYSTLQTCLIKDKNTFRTLDKVNQEFNLDDSIVDILILMFDYDILKTNSLNDSLLYIHNNQLYDVDGRTESPYIKKEVIAVTTEDSAYNNVTVSFRIKEDMFFSNKSKSIQQIEIDFDNNSGYEKINLNSTQNVSYNSAGIKDIKVKITLSNGDIKYSHTKLEVVMPGGGLKSYRFISSDFSKTIKAEKDYPTGSGIFASGQIDISYGRNNGGKLRKPLIIVEGFDTWQIMADSDYAYNYNDIISDLNQAWASSSPFDLTGKLESANIDEYNYDIVFLNFGNGYDYIQRNAFLLEKVIKWVNDNKESDEPNIVMGLSMGGLVSRYALANMEKNNVDHDTKLFISLDSPHQGANIPLGLQYMVMDFASASIAGVKLSDQSPDLLKGKQILSSPAAQQMLIVQTNSVANMVRANFMKEYTELGYPKNCRCVAVSNGSVCGKTQNFKSYDELFSLTGTDGNYSMSLSYGWTAAISGVLTYLVGPAGLLLNLFSGDYEPQVAFYARAMPDHKNLIVYDGKIELKKTTLGFITTWTTIYNAADGYSGIHPPFDNAPGAMSGPAYLGFDINQVPFNPSCNSDLEFCFVPTYSAFDIPITTTAELQYPIGTYDKLLTKTPFDMVLGCTGGNNSHMNFFGVDDGNSFGQNKGSFIWDEITGNYERNSCYDTFKDAPLDLEADPPILSGTHLPWLPAKTYKALNSITCPAKAKRAIVEDWSATEGYNEKTEFIAGKQINLLPGFHAKSGSKFTAKAIGVDCVWNPVTCQTSKSANIAYPINITFDFNDKKSSISYENIDMLNISENTIGNDIVLFPNPAENNLNLNVYLNQDNNITIDIYDINQLCVKHFTVKGNRGTNTKTIDISGLVPGYYILNLNSSEINHKKQFIKM